MIPESNYPVDAKPIELDVYTPRCAAAALHANYLGRRVAVSVPESDMQIVGPLESFRLQLGQDAESSHKGFTVRLRVAGFSIKVDGDHSVYVIDAGALPDPLPVAVPESK